MRNIAKIVALTALAVTVLSGCAVPLRTQERAVQELQDEYQERILEHFHENEELFNRFVVMFFEFLETHDEVLNYRYQINFRHDSRGRRHIFEDRYFFEIFCSYERRDFVYTDIEATDKLTYDELDKIFLGNPSYELLGASRRLWSPNNTFLSFSGDNSLTSGRGAFFSLIYSSSGEASPWFDGVNSGADTIYRINNNWFVAYFFR